MAREQRHSRYSPLQFTQHGEQYAPDALRATPGFPALFPREATERWRRQMGRFTNQPKGPLAYRTPNGTYDPLTIAAVMDCLLRLELGPYINAGNLTFELSRTYDQINWDPITVGKILADLHSFAIELTMPSEHHERPIYVRKRGGVRNYLIHNDPHGWQWLGLVRDYMGQKAEEYTRDDVKTRSIELWAPVQTFKYGQRVEVKK